MVLVQGPKVTLLMAFLLESQCTTGNYTGRDRESPRWSQIGFYCRLMPEMTHFPSKPLLS